VTITKVGETWQFGSEFELEECIWQNLPQLLNLKPFKRQFSVKGQYCDIVAIDDRRRLSVIELKNVEDRYVIQQLTRYHDALKQEKPFGDEVDWEQPIQLIAIAPSFHQDTLTDCIYSLLKFELIRFALIESARRLQLELTDRNSKPVSSTYVEAKSDPQTETIQVPGPPRKLLNWLSTSLEVELKGMLGVREQVLSFDSRMKEIVEAQAIIYGRGKSKPCAEIRRITLMQSKQPQLFLWLPDLEDKPHVLRMMVWSFENWETVSGIIYSPSGSKTKRAWNFPECMEYMQRIGYKTSLRKYKKVMSRDGKTCSLQALVNLALQVWVERF
jgi:RecB family endonuclease NucS